MFVLIAGVLNLLSAVIVYARDTKKLENIAYAVLGLGIALWCFGIAGFSLDNDTGGALLWAKMFYFAPLMIAVASVVLSQVFLYRKPLHTIVNFIIGLYGVILSLFLLTDKTFLTSSVINQSYGKQVVLQKFDYTIYAVFFLACSLVTIGMMFYKIYDLKHKLLKQQAIIFIAGYLIAILLGLYFNLILPWLNNYSLIALGPISSTFLFFAIAYAIIKHRLFDIKLAVARSLAYVFSLLTVGGVFFFITFLLSSVIIQHHKISSNLTRGLYTVLALVLAYTFPYPKKFFDRFTKRLFYRDMYDQQIFLDDFNKIIVSTFDLDKLMKNILNLIRENIKPSFVAIVINDYNTSDNRVYISKLERNLNIDDNSILNLRLPKNDKLIVTDNIDNKKIELQRQLQDNNIALVVRLSTVSKDDSSGYMVLGNKKTGNIYSFQDIKTIEIIANELVVTLQNAMHTKEIEDFNINLQDRIKNATQRLRKTNDKLKALDEAKDDFVSMASHQLRTPLTSVKGNISLVLDGDAGKITDLQRKLLEQAFTSSQRMVFLIADLLNVSRLKTGKFVIERSAVDLADIVEEEVNQLVDTAKSRHLTLTYEKPEDISLLMIDETKTRQVIMNFVDNAIYYTPAGGKIDVVLSETPSSVECRVIDNGIGVPLRERPHLFTKFYRADNARKARPDGTGLGLFMAKKVIVAEGGAIIFDSEEGKGSTFGFSFPKSQLAVDSFVPDEANDQTAAVSVN